jgi:hypothetical protein
MEDKEKKMMSEDFDIKKSMAEFNKMIDAYDMEDRLAAYACHRAGISPEYAKELGIH